MPRRSGLAAAELVGRQRPVIGILKAIGDADDSLAGILAPLMTCSIGVSSPVAVASMEGFWPQAIKFGESGHDRSPALQILEISHPLPRSDSSLRLPLALQQPRLRPKP